MSSLRHRFSIVLDGTEHEIVTSARDMAHVETDASANAAEQTFRLMHAACKRLKIPGTPATWERFADLLDDFDDLETDEAQDEVPTQARASVG